MFIGITGGIGSGKTYICNKFKAMGIPVYNSDERAKYIMNNDAELIAKLITSFGAEIYKNGFPTGSWLEVKGLALPEFMVEIELEVHKSE